MKSPMTPLDFFNTIIHGNLGKLNPELLTKKNLMIQDNTGATGFHWIAHHGQLNLLPPNLLTVQNLSVKDKDNRTPLHEAGYNGYLNQIPTKLLTEKTLLLIDVCDNTPLIYAAHEKQLHLIPYPVLSNLKQECLKNTTIAIYEHALQETKEIYKKELILKIPKKLKRKTKREI
jgi:hypothetical protein